MSEQTPETTPVDEAPELTDPVGQNGASLMGIASWPVAEVPAAPVLPVGASPAELRAQAEKLLAEADAIDAQH